MQLVKNQNLPLQKKKKSYIPCVCYVSTNILCTTSKFRNLILIRYYYLIYLLHSIIADCPLRPFYSTPFPYRRITHRIEMYLQPLFQRRLHLSPLRLREAGEEVHSPWRWMLFTPVHLHTELCHHPSQGTGCQLPGSPC